MTTARHLLAVSLLGGAVLVGGAVRPLPQDPDLATRVKALEATVKEQAATIEALRADQESLEAVVLRHDAWLLRLPAHLEGLANGVRKARELGFTYAGANTEAKETVLETLESLAKDLAVGTAPPREER